MKNFTEKKKFGLRRKDAGQALVEMAIVLPFLLLLVCGIIEFGRAMYIKNTLTSAARAGVRAAVVTPDCVDKTYAAGTLATSRSTTDIIQQKIYDSMINVPDRDKAYATIDVIGKNGTPTLPDDTVTATVSVPFNTIVKGILKMLRPDNTAIVLVGTASMRFE